MAGKNGRTGRAQEKALKYLDYVMECFETPDFVEVTGITLGMVTLNRAWDLVAPSMRAASSMSSGTAWSPAM